MADPILDENPLPKNGVVVVPQQQRVTNGYFPEDNEEALEELRR